jgi:hypothetical protein
VRHSILWFIFLGALWGSLASARTWYVPGDAPTIQAGIDSASVGDTVLVASGRYAGPDNTNLDFGGKDLVLLSEAGATATFIDCENESNTRGLRFISGETSATVVDGFTFENGNKGTGAGIFCTFSSPTITNCAFRNNRSTFQGGGFYCSEGSSPVIIHCIFADNTAAYDGGGAYTSSSTASFSDCVFENNEVWEYMSWGGGLHSYESLTTVSNCIFINNEAYLGGGLFCLLGPPTHIMECIFTANAAYQGGGLLCTSSGAISVDDCTFSGNMASNAGAGLSVLNFAELDVSNTIVAFSTDGQGFQKIGMASLHCCDIFGNAEGDWVGGIADQYGVDGNISADPLFCDTENQDFSLMANSPCLPGNHPDGADCGQIGALGQGCSPVGIDGVEVLPLTPFLAVSPNPSSGLVGLRYQVSGAEAAMDVFDITGRLIRTYKVTSPTGIITWDATTAADAPVASGTYFIRLKAGGEAATKHTVLLR